MTVKPELAALNKMKNAADTETFIEGDVAFHNAILESSGNRVCQRTFPVLEHALLNSMKRTLSASHADFATSPDLKSHPGPEPGQARVLTLEHLKYSTARNYTTGDAKVTHNFAHLLKGRLVRA
jgi:hypothetical protein